MDAISAIGKAFYMVEPIRPVSRKDGSKGLIANVKSEKEAATIADKFSKNIESELKSYDRNGKILNKNLPDKKIENNRQSMEVLEEGNSEETKKTSQNPAKNELAPEEEKQVEKLKKIDREVRAHEQAHQAAGGGLIRGGPNYQYQKGPDGRNYAVGGEVQIDISPVSGNPQATIMKMQQVKRAAMAPANPSPQDRSAASRASQIAAQARQELTKVNIESATNGISKEADRTQKMNNELEEAYYKNNTIQENIISRYA